MRNKAIVSIVAFREVNGSEQLTLLTVEGNSDWYELPAICLDESEDVEETITSELQSIVGFEIPNDAIIPVKTYSSKDKDGICLLHSYAVVLPTWTCRPRGTNLMLYNPLERRLTEQLAENQDVIFFDALDAIKAKIVSLQGLPGLSSELKNKFWEALVTPAERESWVSELYTIGAKTDTNGKYVYDYLHPCLTCDALVLSVTDTSELMIPLIKRANTGTGDGLWALPGGFVQKDDFVTSGWDESEKLKYDSKQKYLEDLSGGKSVIDIATRRILKAKTGLELSEDANLYPLSVICQDNPRHGWTDGAPIVSRSYLAILGQYASGIHLHFEDSHVQDVRWFKIKRSLYNYKGEIIVEEGGEVNASSAKTLGKNSEFDLSYNPSLSDVYIKDGVLYIDHFQGDIRPAREHRGVPADVEEFFAHHGEVVVAALEYIKSNLYTSNILPEFLISEPGKPWSDTANSFSMDRFRKILSSISCFETECRQNLYDKVVLLTKNGKENNGFLSAIGRESYCLDSDRFARFCYKRTRKL